MPPLRARTFYLAFFALFSGECLAKAATPASSYNPDVCALEPKAKVSDACASYADLDKLNDRLHPYVRNLANNTDFFSYYRLNLYDKKCPFWNDETSLCRNIACAVTTIEREEDIPKIWRAEELSKLEGPRAQHPGKKQQRERQRPLLDQLGTGVGESCVVEYDDECDERDYCVPEDVDASGKGDYVSLANNPERFTGYAGQGAHQVWEAIYRENCFSRPLTSEHSIAVPGLSAPFPGFSQNQAQAAQDLKQVMRNHDRQEAIKSGVLAEDRFELEDECLEKRVFYRIISGMHASISTHLCYDYLNQSTGQWGPNLQCYKERLHEHPERISNLYFNYALVLRAVGKLRDYVPDYTFCTGDPGQDKMTRDMITRLASAIPAGPQIFDESVMFQDHTANGISLKEDFRNRFRNVSRIMDCVGCDKCRLWGKIQTNGLGTALKVLFEFGNEQTAGEKPLLRRTELVALINTLDKISLAMKALEHFRGMIAAELNVAKPIGEMNPSSSTQAGEEHEEPDDSEEAQLDPLLMNQDNETLTDLLWQELDTVWRAYIFVLKQWMGLPNKLGNIATHEMSRLTDFWLGRPIRPRGWEIRLPTQDEL